jgi:hypothetical protein
MTDITDLTNEETVQQICQYIDGNVCCSAEEHCRALEYQLDRIERWQQTWVKHVNESLSPDLLEIRNALREKGD